MTSAGKGRPDGPATDLAPWATLCLAKVHSIYVPGNVCGQDVRFLFDTGSTCTVLSKGCWDRIPPVEQPALEAPDYRLKSVTGTVLQVLGACTLGLRLGGYSLTARVQIACVDEEGVLGLDVLSRYGGQWD